MELCVTRWSVQDVADWIKPMGICPELFVQQEVDGEALALATPETLHLLGLKLGPAIKLHQRIQSLMKFEQVSEAAACAAGVASAAPMDMQLGRKKQMAHPKGEASAAFGVVTLGATPAAKFFRRACAYGDTKLVIDMLERRARLDAVDRSGWGPLHYAVDGGKEETLTTLLQLEADPNLKDRELHTPLDLALYQKDISVNNPAKELLFSKIVEILWSHGGQESTLMCSERRVKATRRRYTCTNAWQVRSDSGWFPFQFVDMSSLPIGSCMRMRRSTKLYEIQKESTTCGWLVDTDTLARQELRNFESDIWRDWEIELDCGRQPLHNFDMNQLEPGGESISEKLWKHEYQYQLLTESDGEQLNVKTGKKRAIRHVSRHDGPNPQSPQAAQARGRSPERGRSRKRSTVTSREIENWGHVSASLAALGDNLEQAASHQGSWWLVWDRLEHVQKSLPECPECADDLRRSQILERISDLQTTWDADDNEQTVISLQEAIHCYCRPEVTTMTVDDILYSQRAASRIFSHGEHRGRSVEEVAEDLVSGRIDTQSEEMMLDVVRST